MRKITIKGWEILRTYFDQAINLLKEVKSGYYYDQESFIETMTMELRFLKMFFWGLAYWEDLNYDWHMPFLINSMMFKFTQVTKEFGVDGKVLKHKILDQKINWDIMLYDLEEAIRQFKPHVKEICITLLGGAFKCTPCSPNQKLFLEYGRDTESFIDFIIKNVEELLKLDWIDPLMKKQILTIQEELRKPIRMFDNPSNKLLDLISGCRTWSNRISCLMYLYFIDGKDKSLAPFMETMLSGCLDKTVPLNAFGPIASYFQHTTIFQLLARSLDFIIQDLVIPLKNDIEFFHENLIFLISFIMDPHEDDSGMIWVEIFGVINNFPSLIYSIHFEVLKGGNCLDNISNFLMVIKSLKMKLKDLYHVMPYSSQFSPPNTNVVGFFKRLIEDLKQLLEEEGNLIPSLKQLGELLQKELELLWPIVRNVMEPLQDEHVEIKDLWTKIIDMIYNADYIIKFCPARCFAVWYGIIILPYFVEHVKIFMIEIKNVGVKYRNKMLTGYEMETTYIPSQSRATNSKFEGSFIGFKEDKQVIIDYLTRGSKSLTIISISGLGGQGKTTLAKKIYNDRNIQGHFHNMIWCYVSKDFTTRELLIKIISDVNKKGWVNNMETEDLVTHLWRSLKGKRYLVVMDDIWDVDAWKKLERSFPDDKNGSRILFTSRNHALRCSISHPIPLFLPEESWELMKKKVFGHSECAKEFVEIGEKIASYCKGLPLAVVLIAGILERIDKKLDKENRLKMWHEVADNLKVHLAHQGCGKVIELSYKYLPNHLKSCFLYFGAFRRGESISAKELKLLWIGEGCMIHDGEMNLATKYLDKLVSQSLVVVTKWGTLGGIKSCSVHDLLYDLCLEKGNEENFLIRAEENLLVEQCTNSRKRNMYSHHRLKIGAVDHFIRPKPIFTKTKLPMSPLQSLIWKHSFSEFSFHFLESFKLLTVLSLNLSTKKSKFDEFPKIISCLIHLRHLKLRGDWNYHCRSVLQAIAHLGKLETLIIAFVTITLPMSVCRMKSLRHVYIHFVHLDLENYDDHQTSNDSGVEYSRIERLGCIYLDCDIKTAGFLRSFSKLRKLDCMFFCKNHILELFSMIGCLKELDSLKIFGGGGIDYKKDKQTWDLTDMGNLKRLSLEDLNLPWSVVTKIGKHLPNLQVLKLLEDAMALDAKTWKLEDGDFPQLRYLKLSHIWGIEEIDVSSCDDNPPFPRLEHLVVDECYKLKEIPLMFGEFPSLNTIEVMKSTGIHASALNTSAMVILEQQNDIVQNYNFELMIDGIRQ